MLQCGEFCIVVLELLLAEDATDKSVQVGCGGRSSFGATIAIARSWTADKTTDAW